MNHQGEGCHLISSLTTRQDRRDKTSLYERVYDHVCQKIASGELKQGAKITELGICGELGISRAPVREALHRLAEDHIVVLVPRSRCFVATLSREEIEEIYEIREHLECMALRHAFDKIEPDQARRLQSTFKQCLKLGNSDFIREGIELDVILHKLITDKSGCRNLETVLEKIKSRLQIFRTMTFDSVERAQAALNEHVEVLEGIIQNDKRRSINALKKHIRHSRNNMLATLKD